MSVQIDGSTGNIIAIKADYSGDVSIGGTLTYEDVTNIDAVGLITARNGIKVDDLGVQVGTGATIDGATNTLTFLTNGSERFRVDSSGNLGLGESSSIDARLHVNSGTDNTTLFLESTDGDVNLGMADNAGSCRLLQEGGNLRFRTGGNANAFGTGDSERMVLTSNGRALLGHTTNVNNHLQQITTSNGAALGLLNYQATDDGPEVTFIKSRNGTKGSHTVVNNGDFLGRIFFRGSDGDSYERGVEIAAQVDGTPGDSDMPGRLLISTTADGASTPTERMRIDSSGNAIFKNSNYVSFNDNGYIRTDSSGYLRLQMGSNGIMFTNSSNSE